MARRIPSVTWTVGLLFGSIFSSTTTTSVQAFVSRTGQNPRHGVAVSRLFGNDENNEDRPQRQEQRQPYRRQEQSRRPFREPPPDDNFPAPRLDSDDNDDDYYYDDDESSTAVPLAKVRREYNDNEYENCNPDEPDDYYYNNDDDDDDDDDYYTDDKDDDYYDAPLRQRPPRQQQQQQQETTPPPRGNFWSNPLQNWDEDAPSPKRKQPKRRSKPTTFRSGTPRPPAPVEDFYNRFFWYGVEDTTSSSDGDATMFGGTKGKFNGLAFIGQAPAERPVTRRKRRQRPDYEEEENYYYSNNDNVDDRFDASRMDKEEEEEEDWNEPLRRQAPVTPPYDPPRPMQRRQRQPPPRPLLENDNDDDEFGSSSSRRRPPPPRRRRTNSSRRRTRPRPQYNNDDDDNEWSPTDQVWDWFTGEDDKSERESSRRGRRKRDQQQWSPWNVLDTFLGVDRDELQEKAQEYNRKMGISSNDDDNESFDSRKNPRRPRRRSGNRPPRRTTYRYEPDTTIADDFTTRTPLVDTNDDTIIDTEPIPINDDDNDTKKETTKPEIPALTWEERSLMMERIPPADIPAWGPTGDLGMDARTKAVQDAMEDLALAKARIESLQEKQATLREKLVILRVDAQLERKRLSQSRMQVKTMQERLRQMDADIDQMARSLRYAQMKVTKAQEDLAALERRHWAVLSVYDPERAGQQVQEALQELVETEPAARRVAEKTAQASAAGTDGTTEVSSSPDAVSQSETGKVGDASPPPSSSSSSSAKDVSNESSS